MKSLLQQLGSNEAILLMYLAGELADEDHAEVQRMLASDAALRAQLEAIQLAHESAMAALAQADHSMRSAIPEALAIRRVSRQIQQWLLTRRPRIQEIIAQRRMPWGRLSFATAASLTVGFFIWSVYHLLAQGPTSLPPTDMPHDERVAVSNPVPTLTEQEKLSLLSGTLDGSDADVSTDMNVVAAAPRSAEIDFSVNSQVQ